MYYIHQIRPNWGLNSLPLDHDSILHVTKTPTLTTRPSMAFSAENIDHPATIAQHQWSLSLNWNYTQFQIFLSVKALHTLCHPNPKYKLTKEVDILKAHTPAIAHVSLLTSRFGVLVLLRFSSAEYPAKTIIKFNKLYTKIDDRLT